MTLQIVSFPRPQPVLLFCSCLFKCILPVSLSIVVSKGLKLSLFHFSYWWAVGCRSRVENLFLTFDKDCSQLKLLHFVQVPVWEVVVRSREGEGRERNRERDRERERELGDKMKFQNALTSVIFESCHAHFFNEEIWSKHSRFCFTLCCQPHFHKWYIDQNYFVASVFHS